MQVLVEIKEPPVYPAPVGNLHQQGRGAGHGGIEKGQELLAAVVLGTAGVHQPEGIVYQALLARQGHPVRKRVTALHERRGPAHRAPCASADFEFDPVAVLGCPLESMEHLDRIARPERLDLVVQAAGQRRPHIFHAVDGADAR